MLVPLALYLSWASFTVSGKILKSVSYLGRGFIAIRTFSTFKTNTLTFSARNLSRDLKWNQLTHSSKYKVKQ